MWFLSHTASSVPIVVNGRCFSGLICSQISVNIHKYPSHLKLISYLTSMVSRPNYLILILKILKVNIGRNQRSVFFNFS